MLRPKAGSDELSKSFHTKRKFLVRTLPETDQYSSRSVWDGYLTREDAEVEVRIRVINHSDGQLIATAPSTNDGRGEAVVERLRLPTELTRILARACGSQYSEKRQYMVPLTPDEAVLDVYSTPSGILSTVVVKFLGESESMQFTPPRWFGEEITGRGQYSNRRIASGELPPAEAE
jgi:CYTH domain-containing protein